MTRIHLLLAAALLIAAPAAFAGAKTEKAIRDLEQLQAKAAIARDRATLEKIFAPDFKIINPSGAVSGRDVLLTLLASDGPAPYASAAYTTDEVRDYGNVVVSIGMDTVVPNTGPQAGKTVLRRVTQVWQKQKGMWRLTLRHANIITAP
jgi:uncharacterized protein (TIGR02246 family)